MLGVINLYDSLLGTTQKPTKKAVKNNETAIHFLLRELTLLITLEEIAFLYQLGLGSVTLNKNPNNVA